MKLEDLKFTDKQAKRILAEAAEKESRDYNQEGRTINYNQLVKIAEEATIDPKYLKASTKQLVKETGGLERAAIYNTLNKVTEFHLGIFQGLFFAPTAIRKIKSESESEFYNFPAILSSGLGNFFSLIAHIGLYNHEIGPLTFAMHIGTNIASGIYELYRREKGKLIEEINGKDKK